MRLCHLIRFYRGCDHFDVTNKSRWQACYEHQRMRPVQARQVVLNLWPKSPRILF